MAEPSRREALRGSAEFRRWMYFTAWLGGLLLASVFGMLSAYLVLSGVFVLGQVKGIVRKRAGARVREALLGSDEPKA